MTAAATGTTSEAVALDERVDGVDRFISETFAGTEPSTYPPDPCSSMRIQIYAVPIALHVYHGPAAGLGFVKALVETTDAGPAVVPGIQSRMIGIVRCARSRSTEVRCDIYQKVARRGPR
jgi:hypothetical protein